MGGANTRLRPPLVSRDGVIQSIEELLDGLRVAGVALALVGEPGIGKSRMVDHVAKLPALRDMSLVRTRAFELDTNVPFSVASRLFGLRSDSPDEQAADLGRVLIDGPTHREDRFLSVADGVVDLLERRASSSPVVVVLDDAHWADGVSLRILERVIHDLDHLRVAVILAARPQARPPELGAVLRSTGSHPRGRRIQLEPLAREDAVGLAEDLLGVEPGPALRRAIAATGGNPLYLVELLTVAARDDLVEDGDLRDGQVPTALRDLVLQHLAMLPEATLDVLRVAAVLGPTFDLQHLALVLRLRELDVVAALQPALDAAVVVESEERLTFVHDLFQESLYDDQPEAVRAARHRAVVDAMRDGRAPVIDVVPHLLRTDWSTIPDAAALLHDAGIAMRGRSSSVAAELLLHALEAATLDVDPRWQLDAASAALVAGRVDDAKSVFAALSCRPLASFDQEVRDQLVGPWATVFDPVAPFEQRADLLDRLEQAGLSELGRARAEERRAALFLDAGRRDEARTHAGKALRAATAVRSDELLALVELQLCRIALGDGRWDDTAAHAVAAVEHARRVGDPFAFVDAAVTHSFAVGNHPDGRDAARHVIEEAAAVAARSGSPLLQAATDVAAGVHDARWGAWEDALARFEAAISLLEGYDDLLPMMMTQVPARAARLHAHRGEHDLAAERLQAAWRLTEAGTRVRMSADDMLIVHSCAMDVALLADRVDDAVHAADAFVELARSRGADVYESLHAPLLYEVAYRAGDDPRVDEVVSRASEVLHEDSQAWEWQHARWVAARRVHDADTLAQLIGPKDAHGIPWEFLPRLREDAAEALARDARVDEAVGLLDQALTMWEGVGAHQDVARVRARLRELGVHRGRGSAADRPDTGWDALTDAEWRVVRLVAEGLVYREIGERLFISRRTVETHMRNVFRKLDVSSRSQLAARLIEPEGRLRLRERQSGRRA